MILKAVSNLNNAMILYNYFINALVLLTLSTNGVDQEV